MADMVTSGAHAKPAARHDHLWVLAVIAACVLAEVWASWVGIGAISGFPRIDSIPTDWVLAVAMEAYWGYALYAWLVASPGPRSRAMAMWSCAVVFALSLTGQVLYHELTASPGTPPGRRVVIGFVTSLPVIVLALIAVLIHLRHVDRSEAVEVAEQDSLRAELEAERAARQAAESELGPVRAQLAEAVAKAEVLARKLEAAKPRKRTGTSNRNRNRKPSPAAPGTSAPEDVPDIDAEARILALIDEGYSASKAGVLAGKSDSYGRQVARLRNAAKKEPAGEDRTDGDMATGEQPAIAERTEG